MVRPRIVGRSDPAHQCGERTIDFAIDGIERDGRRFLVFFVCLVVAKREDSWAGLQNDDLTRVVLTVVVVVLENQVLRRVMDAGLAPRRSAIGKRENDRETGIIVICLTIDFAGEAAFAEAKERVNRRVSAA